MPKATSKKKKYNARFPPARIKKIMQMDEEVGKVAAAVPVIISRALEMFIESLVTETSKVTRAKNAKTLSTSHIKHTITGTKQFDFLRDLVQNVPDHQAEDNGESSFERDPSVVKMGRGRPRMVDEYKKREKQKGNKASSDEEDKDDDEDSEETETDDESTSAQTSYQEDFKPSVSYLPGVQSNVSYSSDFKPSLPHPTVNPNIEQLLQAASSIQQQHQHHHSSLQSDNGMNHNNNNNYVPSSAAGPASLQGLPVIRDSLVSFGEKYSIRFELSESSFKLKLCATVPPLSQIKQPFYQMPSNYDSPPPSHFSSQLPTKVSFYNSNSNPLSIPSYIQSPISQKLSQQQQQPIDLSHPLRQNIKDEDDYDT